VGKITGLDFADDQNGERDLFPERNDRFCPHRNQHDARNRPRGSKLFLIHPRNVVRRWLDWGLEQGWLVQLPGIDTL
tara:strand:- start:223 stop:453 length:231 start_codon:yes stop_codon:yes gene_type:complete